MRLLITDTVHVLAINTLRIIINYHTSKNNMEEVLGELRRRMFAIWNCNE